MKSGKTIFSLATLLTVSVIGLTLILSACGDKVQKPEFKTEYQAIFLTTGNVFFGKIEKYAPNYIQVTDVYIPQSQVNPDTKQTVNFVVSRAKQWHKPDVTFISPTSVAMVEPVSADSDVVKWIKDDKAKAQAQ
jgi:hypothetical protein